MGRKVKVGTSTSSTSKVSPRQRPPAPFASENGDELAPQRVRRLSTASAHSSEQADDPLLDKWKAFWKKLNESGVEKCREYLYQECRVNKTFTLTNSYLKYFYTARYMALVQACLEDPIVTPFRLLNIETRCGRVASVNDTD